jgi:hypothetical protein
MMDLRGKIATRALAANARNRTAEAAWDLILDWVGNPEFIVVCAFAAIGLLASICLAMLFPLSHETAGFVAQFL